MPDRCLERAQLLPGPRQIEDPDKIINEFVSPFVQWCHTVQGGAYASCPVWITECPVGDVDWRPQPGERDLRSCSSTCPGWSRRG